MERQKQKVFSPFLFLPFALPKAPAGRWWIFPRPFRLFSAEQSKKLDSIFLAFDCKDL
jgi:hypothetical protein